MLVLVIDTSTPAVTAGVVEIPVARGAVVVRAAHVVVGPRRHGEVLAPSIAAAFRDAGCTAADLTGVVAGVGPGPFTGLRVGLATADAVALAAGIPTYAVCSLDGIGARTAGDGVLVATDARRREVYWATYTDGARRAGPGVATPAGLAARLGELGVLTMVGPGARAYEDVLGLRLGDVEYPAVAELAALAAERVRAAAPAEALVPLYLRHPDAVPPRDVVQPG
ncbi:MAG: tRNA (adenosine(37)-N6)-threonylcarbamoyltransferase complex dimerization subunit type 1 TsaB [Mycobacteriales bacterium]